MQVFKAFIKTAYKYLPAIAVYFFVFTFLAVLLSFSATDTNSSVFKTVALDVGVMDEDHSDASAALIDYMDTLHNISYMEDKQDVLLDNLYYRNVEYIFIIPKGFEERLLAGEQKNLFETVQIPGIYSSAFVDAQINAYLKTAQLYLAGEESLADALSKAAVSLSDDASKVQVLKPAEGTKVSAAMTSIYYFYQFIPYVLMSMILCGLTPILTTFWEKNLAKRISCSSTSLLNRNLQLALGSVLYSLFNWGLFILTAAIIYGGELFSKNGFLCIANSFMLLPLSVALSLIISSFTPSGNVINMINNVIALGMSFICGVFIPQQQLGESVLAFSKFLPFYWYVKNNNLISGFSGETFTYEAYWQNMGIQLLFIIALFAIALVASKFRTSKHKA